MERSDLEVLYDEAGSVTALARVLGIGYSTARYRLRRAGIAIRTTGFKSPKTRSRRGREHHNWKGGTYTHSDGYVYEYAPDHPAAPAAKGYVLQHRLVMERKLGRYLTDEELVHHRNEVKDDNRASNLELTSRRPHMSHHKSSAQRDERGRFL